MNDFTVTKVSNDPANIVADITRDTSSGKDCTILTLKTGDVIEFQREITYHDGERHEWAIVIVNGTEIMNE